MRMIRYFFPLIALLVLVDCSESNADPETGQEDQATLTQSRATERAAEAEARALERAKAAETRRLARVAAAEAKAAADEARERARIEAREARAKERAAAEEARAKAAAELAAKRTARAETRALEQAAQDAATLTNVNGTPFRVAVIEERAYALVSLVGSRTPYFPSDLELAARNVTLCEGRFSTDGFEDADDGMRARDLNRVRGASRVNGWRVDLRC